MKYLEVQTSTVEGTNGISYAYRRLGPRGRRPLVLLGNLRGNSAERRREAAALHGNSALERRSQLGSC